MKRSAEYRKTGRENLKNKWGIAIGVCLIITALSSLVGTIVPYVGAIITLLIAGQLAVAEFTFFIKLHKKEEVGVDIIFKDFFTNLMNNFLTNLLMSIYQALWFLLFIIPGIIKKYSYSMTMFLKAKQPELEANEAITLSRKKRDGKKWKLCCLEFSFIGWMILSVLSLGIGFIFLAPYMKTTFTAFFEDVYAEYREANPSCVVEDVKTNEEIHL